MDDVSRRVISRLAGRHPVKTLRGRLSRLGLTRHRALTAVPALLVVPLMAGVSGSAVSPQAGEPGPPGAPTVNWALSGQATATSARVG